jgi:hypothetical protein
MKRTNCSRHRAPTRSYSMQSTGTPESHGGHGAATRMAAAVGAEQTVARARMPVDVLGSQMLCIRRQVGVAWRGRCGA